MGGAALDAQDERVALRRARVPGQHMLQHRDELVAMAGHDARVVDGWHAPKPRQSVHGAHIEMRRHLCITHGMSGWLANSSMLSELMPPELRLDEQKKLTLLV